MNSFAQVMALFLSVVHLAASASSEGISGGRSPVTEQMQVPPARFDDPARRQKLINSLPQIDELMSDRMKELSTPGLAYAVIMDNEIVLSKGLGVRDTARNAPADADTVFRIASMTKSFTALAILKLRDAGKLSLDDPVTRFVPEVGGWPPPTADSGPITIRHLLAHTAGFPEDNPYGDRLLNIAPDAFSAWLSAGVPFSTATGSAFEYSNLGFMLLGRVIARVSGQPYQTYITEQILLPLGMRSTYWSPAAVPRELLARGYRKDKDSWVEEPMLEDGEAGAMGGLLTSSRDLGRYVAMMLSAYPPRDDPEALPVLRRTLREMQAGLGNPTVYAMRDLPGGRLVGRGGSYGYGLSSVMDCAWGREAGHGGGLPGFGSHMRWLPDSGVGVLVLTNGTYADAWKLTRAALSLLQTAGALEPRAATPSPMLLQAIKATADLVDQWSDEKARGIAANNLFLDESLEERRSAVTKTRAELGTCRLGRIDAENALRGKFRMDCDKGWLDVSLTLAPLKQPRVQFLEVKSGKPPSDALRQSAEAVARAIAMSPQDLRLAPTLKRTDLAATLESTRLSYGSCSIGQAIEGDGAMNATFALNCDHGPLELNLALEQGRISRATITPSGNARCAP